MSSVASNHEKALAGVAVMVVLYAVLLLVLGDRLTPAYWNEKGRVRQALSDQRREQRALIGQEPEWRRQFDELRDMMPVFASDRRVDTYWLGVMDKVASRHGVSIGKRQIGAEIVTGDAYEMPIVCKDFEATLDSLVRFLYDLHAEGAMLDIRQMYVRPAPNNVGQLRGDFTLYCAYLRDDAGSAPAGSPDASPDAETP
ncbi:MAG: hypothetical protein ACOX5G_07990 [Kiritimatiellia bacterium]|jgi:hypothetical protein